MNKNLIGLHHITAITSSAPKIFNFMIEILGLHLIKKTVNQDYIRTYHLYFTDDMVKAGTDITFFDFLGIPKGKQGKNGITRLGFRVPNDKASEWWQDRLDKFEISHDESKTRFGAKYFYFYDFDDQQYQLVSEEKPWCCWGRSLSTQPSAWRVRNSWWFRTFVWHHRLSRKTKSSSYRSYELY
ncbi:VOC family protein [Pediococcus parvulus]|uniref:VOC family protein n=1 Tax=Pediococcus parvulus TaxID=54062 RepID=UPI0021A4F7AD|nr:VOC family protein [Pediococcus parvulus]